MRARISNFLDITKYVILADLLLTDLPSEVISKRIFSRIAGLGLIWMSPVGSIQIVRELLTDLVISI